MSSAPHTQQISDQPVNTPPVLSTGDRVGKLIVLVAAAILVVGYYTAVTVLKLVDRERE